MVKAESLALIQDLVFRVERKPKVVKLRENIDWRVLIVDNTWQLKMPKILAVTICDYLIFK